MSARGASRTLVVLAAGVLLAAARAPDAPPPHFTVPLDRPAEERWDTLGAHFAPTAPTIARALIDTVLPHWSQAAVEGIAARLAASASERFLAATTSGSSSGLAAQTPIAENQYRVQGSTTVRLGLPQRPHPWNGTSTAHS